MVLGQGNRKCKAPEAGSSCKNEKGEGLAVWHSKSSFHLQSQQLVWTAGSSPVYSTFIDFIYFLFEINKNFIERKKDREKDFTPADSSPKRWQ